MATELRCDSRQAFWNKFANRLLINYLQKLSGNRSDTNFLKPNGQSRNLNNYEKGPPAREKFSKTGSKTGPSGAFWAKFVKGGGEHWILSLLNRIKIWTLERNLHFLRDEVECCMGTRKQSLETVWKPLKWDMTKFALVILVMLNGNRATIRFSAGLLKLVSQ